MCGGIGLDLCEIARMEKLCGNDSFLKRFFSEEEIAYIRGKGKQAAQTMAGIFAAKEAFSKAMGTGLSFDLREAEVIHGKTGEPSYLFRGETARRVGNDRFFLSITHEAGVAAAVCFREKEQTAPLCTQGMKTE